MSQEEEEKSGFVIKDKRRFDDSGNRKGDDSSSPSKPAAELPPSTESVSNSKSSSNSSSETSREPSAQVDHVLSENETSVAGEEQMDFSSFVLSLATQAMVQLGEMPAPPGVEIPKNPMAAKYTIDVIEMLNKKTQGNLSETEQQLVNEILHSLRLGYVKLTS